MRAGGPFDVASFDQAQDRQGEPFDTAQGERG
jgi:hypothetical protein